MTPPPDASPDATWAGPLVLGAALLLVLAPFAWSSATFPDEMTQLYDGLRVARGQALYRDFFQFIGPLAPWAGAAVFALFGPSLLAARVVGSSRVDLQACKLEYSIVSPK